jgi:hypothetical protein
MTLCVQPEPCCHRIGCDHRRATIERLDIEIDQKRAMVTDHERRLFDLQRAVAEAEALQTRVLTNDEVPLPG